MVKLLIFDDHAMMRNLMTQELAALDGFTVSAQLDRTDQIENLINRHTPDLIVMDISMPGRDGIETIRDLRTKKIDVPVMCLTMHMNEVLMRKALQSGANGYALKHDAFEDLVYGIRKILAGGTYISSQFNLLGDNTVDTQKGDGKILSSLTQRERDVVTLIAESKKTSEIAYLLSISERTVDAHRRNISEKTGLGDIAKITRFALRVGLIVN